jgi:hypothetical protein
VRARFRSHEIARIIESASLTYPEKNIAEILQICELALIDAVRSVIER